MPTLTETAYITRKALRYTAIGIVAFFVLRSLLIYGIALIKYLNPPPPPAPTMGFGYLPKIQFPQTSGYSAQLTLQTPDGQFPQFPTQAMLFYMPYQRASFSALEQSKALAAKMGFTGEPTFISEEIYEWNKQLPSPLKLTINIINGSFDIDYQWQTDRDLLLNKQLKGRDQTLLSAKAYLEKSVEKHADIDFENGKVSYWRASANTLEPAISLSEADFIKVDYFRSDITPPKSNIPMRWLSQDPLKVLTANPSDGIISLLFSGSTVPQKQIIKISYKYFPVSYEQWETYPLKPVELAFQELQNGKGYIAQGENLPSTITIRRVYLAYYESNEPQKYLQPIYVFSDDEENGFIAYIPAIDSSVVQP